MPCFRYALVVLALFVDLSSTVPGGARAFADEPDRTQPFTIKEQYWQVLPAGWVYVDDDGNPWFATGRGDVAKTYHKKMHTTIDPILLGDRSGRIWVNKRYKNDPTRYYDGKKWHELDFKARLAIEDNAGRVFLLGKTAVHVLDKNQWSRKKLFAVENWARSQFTKDGKGRIWFWAYRGSKRDKGDHYSGTRGVWMFDKGKWTNHHTGNGFPVDAVSELLPLNNERFLVFHADRKATPNYFVWSPGRKLTDKEKSLFAPENKPTHLYGYSTDPDGNQFLGAMGGKSEMLTISPDGAVTWLTPEQKRKFHQMFRGLYENNHRLYSRLGEKPPPVATHPGNVICKDRQGRLYFRLSTRESGVGVLWAKFEKPGDALRATSYRRMIRVLQDSSGTIWGQPYQYETALVKWTGAKWEDTPVKLLPHPTWTNRRGPPWMAWHWTNPVLLPGADGSFLAVVVRDVYQDIAPKLKGKELYFRNLSTLAKAEAEKRGRYYWMEGWLFKDGKWTGPTPIEKLLKDEREFLTKNFTAQPKQTTIFNLQSDGKNLWSAYDGKVTVYTPEKQFEWELPNKHPYRLSQAGFCRLPDGRMLCNTTTQEQSGIQLHALRLKKDGIAAEPFAMPEKTAYSGGYRYWDAWYPFVTARGDLWLWTGYYVYQYKNGKWVLREDLHRPLFEEPDGSLWFMPGKKYAERGKDRGYRIVKGDVTHIYPWPDKYWFGWLTPARNGEVHVACGYWVVTLSKADHPRKRRIVKERISPYWLAQPIFVDNNGHFLFHGSVAK